MDTAVFTAVTTEIGPGLMAVGAIGMGIAVACWGLKKGFDLVLLLIR